MTRGCVLLVAIAIVLGGAPAVFAQAGRPPGGHVHYRDQPRPRASPTGALAPRLQNLGTHTFPVSTRNRQAQLFINQGLNLAYAFNHAEARPGLSRGGASRSRPARWPTGDRRWCSAPTSTRRWSPNEEPKAYELVQKAMSLSGTRHAARARLHRGAGRALLGQGRDRRRATRRTQRRCARCTSSIPTDLDAATLYVESMMDLRPWGYWQRDGAPHAGTAEVVGLTKRVMARNPKHPGALHMY